ncbi:HAD-IB family hydrolase [Niveispirillum irakense]|uniref:HAD-IB family hydrolase n=1 Tax=Niveispirillum irakense TaxID=34011 RepID=UPI00041750F5|nr:HAD-IB family hydrolase [Niveispirillum irakense]
MSQAIAIFDFDGTLIAGDSLLPFLERVAGKRRARYALVRSVRAALMRAGRGKGGDVRTQVKEGLLARTLKGVPEEKARAVAAEMGSWVRWHNPIRDTLLRHADQGHHVVVATGALALYMPSLLEGLPVNHLMATEMEVVDGLLTGRMCHGGNCVRDEKARRVQDYLSGQGPFSATYGYGNRPSDLPFLAMMHHPTIVPTVSRRGSDKKQQQAG